MFEVKGHLPGADEDYVAAQCWLQLEGQEMTRIRATCPACGEVDLQPDGIELHVVRDASGEIADGSRYTFACPGCTTEIAKPADERIARLLATGGVPVSVETAPEVCLPIVVEHPELALPGPALTPDDLLDLHLALQSNDWFAALADLAR